MLPMHNLPFLVNHYRKYFSSEKSGKVRVRPQRKSEIATKSKPNGKTPRNFLSITCLISYLRSDHKPHDLLSLDLLHLTSNSPRSHPENLITALQNQAMPQPKKEETKKTRESFLQSPARYNNEVTGIKYWGVYPFVIRFYPHIFRFFLPTEK